MCVCVRAPVRVYVCVYVCHSQRAHLWAGPAGSCCPFCNLGAENGLCLPLYFLRSHCALMRIPACLPAYVRACILAHSPTRPADVRSLVRTSGFASQLEAIQELKAELAAIRQSISSKYAADVGRDACAVQ